MFRGLEFWGLRFWGLGILGFPALWCLLWECCRIPYMSIGRSNGLFVVISRLCYGLWTKSCITHYKEYTIIPIV